MKGGSVAQALGFLSAAAFVTTGGVHTSGYAGVMALTAGLEGALPGLTGGLWLVFGFHLIALGLVVALLTPPRSGRAVGALAVCGCVPALDAALQVAFVGFVFPPTIMLLGTALLALASAWLGWRTQAAGAPPKA